VVVETYAVIWSDTGDAFAVGKLELGANALRFEGSSETGTPHVHRVPYAEIASVHVERGGRERLRGKPTLVLELSGGGRLRIGSVDGPGILTELVERLGRLKGARFAV